jgi:Amt family ammonium transporter
MVVGAVSGAVYLGASALLVKLKIDDTVDAIPVHGACGIWGLIAVGLFCDPALQATAYGNSVGGIIHGGGTMLGVQILAAIVICGWVALVMTPFFMTLNHFGLFRVSQLEEEVGMDISKHGGAAYNTVLISDEQIKAMEVSRSATGTGGL